MGVGEDLMSIIRQYVNLKNDLLVVYNEQNHKVCLFKASLPLGETILEEGWE